MEVEVTNTLGQSLLVKYSTTNVHINNSYTINKSDIAAWVKLIKAVGAKNGYVYSRSEASWIEEWKAHNVLYKFGIQPSRTKDVDLNEDETALRKLGYCLLSKFYI